MNHDITIPPTADGAFEVTIVSWLKEVGSAVKKGEDIAQASTEKINLYVAAPEDGTLQEIRIKTGEKAKVGDVIGVVAS